MTAHRGENHINAQTLPHPKPLQRAPLYQIESQDLWSLDQA